MLAHLEALSGGKQPPEVFRHGAAAEGYTTTGSGARDRVLAKQPVTFSLADL